MRMQSNVGALRLGNVSIFPFLKRQRPEEIKLLTFHLSIFLPSLKPIPFDDPFN